MYIETKLKVSLDVGLGLLHKKLKYSLTIFFHATAVKKEKYL